MNAAERKRKSREKLKSDESKWKTAQENQKKYDQKRREKGKALRKSNEKSMIQWREKERLRKRKQREKKKLDGIMKTCDSPLGSYKSINTLKKAVVKLKKALPVSPNKKTAVLMHVLKETVPMEAMHQFTKTDKAVAITDEIKKLVINFYEQDDISRPSPNRKDTMSIKDNTGKRAHVAKRHLIMTITEVYALFKTDYPNIKLGKSKFFELRPRHVRPISEIPHNVCVCSYHANYKFLLEALNKHLPTLPISTAEFLNLICCNITTEKCMTSDCEACDDVTDILPLRGLNTALKTDWKQWQTVDGRCHVINVNGILQDLITELINKTPKFKYHTFAKDAQSNFFKQKVSESTDSELVIQVDFAENFTILQQDEIQSAHWNHSQATLFTGCAWAIKGKEKTSYVVMSDELNHHKYSVWLFMKKIIEDLKCRYPNLRKIYVFSDGCAAQFKNRFTLSTLCYSKADWNVETEWNFFASGHGKGAVDGIGATAKQTLWSAIMSRKAVLDTSFDCYKYLAANAPGLKVFFVTIGDIKLVQESLDERWQHIKPIPFIQKHHHFKCHNKSIKYALTGTSQDTKKVLLIQDGKLKYSDVYSSNDEC